METWKAAIIARDLFRHHGIDHWKFRYNQRAMFLGLTVYRDLTIYLSEPYVKSNSEDNVIDTILHEIAHAILPPGHGHNNTWKMVAQNIGANPTRCTRDITQFHKFSGVCEKGHITKTNMRFHKYCPRDGSLITYNREGSI